MKTIVIFYSLEGNTRLIAENLSKTINSDILELKAKKEMKTDKFSKYLWGGKQVMFKEKPELLPFDYNLDEYDLIIFGSPIWAGKCSPAFNTFFSNNKITNKKYALFNCNGGGKTDKFFEGFKSQLVGNEFLGEISFTDPLKKNKEENLTKAKDWVKEIIKKL